MWYKPYGRTGKSISAIGFGGMRFANPQDLEANAQLLLHAFSKGINFFDTAPYYCDDKSEDIFGAAFKRLPREKFYASSKSSEADGGKFRAGLERSLTRLGLQKIDFFHVWCVLTMKAWQERQAGGAVAAALKAKEEGLIEHVVVSSHLPGKDLKQMLAEGPFEGVTLGYCEINFPYRQEAVDAAGQMGLGVVTMNPLGGGLIPENSDTFEFIRGPSDRSAVEAALRFNVSQPAITSALVGFTTRAHIDQAVAAVENFQPYTPEHLDAMRQKVRANFNTLCTGCGYCLPCPAELNIPQMMDAYNQKLLRGGKDQRIVERLAWHWSQKPEAANACTQCGACETRCTQKLPIRERMALIGTLESKK